MIPKIGLTTRSSYVTREGATKRVPTAKIAADINNEAIDLAGSCGCSKEVPCGILECDSRFRCIGRLV